MAVSPTAVRLPDLSPAAGPRRLPALLADPRRVLLLAAAVAAFVTSLDVLDDPDVFWHLRFGRWILDHHAVPRTEIFTYTALGRPLVAHEWLSEVVFALLFSAGGLLLVALAMAAVGWSGFAALALRARGRSANALAIALALLLGARAAQPVLGTRPQVFTFALTCWTMLLVERHWARGGRRIWALPVLFAVWANLHAGAVVGLGMLVAAVALEAARRLRQRPGAATWERIRTAAITLGASALAVCLNPDGPGFYRYVLSASATEHSKPITEWHSPNFQDPAMLGLLLLLVSFPALIALGARINLRDAVLSALAFAAALYAVRNTSIAVAVALPAWAAMFQQLLDGTARWGWKRQRHREAAATKLTWWSPPVLTGALILALVCGAAGVSIARASRDASPSGVAERYPTCAATALARLDGVRLFAPYFQGGYLVDRLWPRTTVFIYGQDGPIGAGVFDDYERALGGGAAATRVLDGSGTNAVLTGPGALRDTIAADAHWQHALDDPMGLSLYLRPGMPAVGC